MEPIVTCKENLLYLDSNLTEEMFAKTRSSMLLNEEGILVSKNTDGSWSNFNTWRFSDIKTIDEKVYFIGNGFCGETAAVTLEKSFSDSGKTLYSISEAIENAIKSNISIPAVSLHGIIVNQDGILFLPEKTFDKCASNHGLEIYSQIRNEWTDSAASGITALNFILGVVSYFAVSSKMPFPFTNEEQHSINLANKNYLPVEYQCNGINSRLAKAINQRIAEQPDPAPFPLDLLKDEIEGVSEKNPIHEEEFSKQALDFWNKQQKKLFRGKKLKKHLFPIAVSAFALIFLSIFAGIIVSEQQKKPTTIGLNSTETVNVFYSGIHHMNTDFMLASAKDCPDAQGYISKIPQISITALMRGAYNFDSGISTPENVLFFEPGSSKFYGHNIFGITDYKIDGIPYTLNQKIPTVKNHTGKVLSENGTRLFTNARSEHTVKYNLVHTVDNIIVVDKYETTVKLTYVKNKWTLSVLSEKFTTEYVNPVEFSDNFKAQLSFANQDVELAVELLRSIYDWLPTAQSIREEKTRLDNLGY